MKRDREPLTTPGWPTPTRINVDWGDGTAHSVIDRPAGGSHHLRLRPHLRRRRSDVDGGGSVHDHARR